MFGGNVKIDKALLARVKAAAESAGYSSADELIVSAIEKELERIDAEKNPSATTDQAVLDRLKGLGYIE